jgi:type I restriction enzyme M protein
MTDAHRQWIKTRYREGWKQEYADSDVKVFRNDGTVKDFAYHKVEVVFWQTDEHDQPAIITEPYERAFTAANLKKEQVFHESGLTFRVRLKTGKVERTETLKLMPTENAANKLKVLLEGKPQIVSVEWTHRHYVKDDEYIPYGEDILGFLKREIAKPIIRWEDRPQLGYEILPNKYFYRYQQPTPAKDLLREFWKLEKDAEKKLDGLTNS